MVYHSIVFMLSANSYCAVHTYIQAKYYYRLVIDEAFSFGVLGATGRGVTEHYHVPIDAIDIMTISLAHSLSSVGGACVGKSDVVDHQRL
jgi:serine palmitoyltransferase